jgi:hypothetical protein
VSRRLLGCTVIAGAVVTALVAASVHLLADATVPPSSLGSVSTAVAADPASLRATLGRAVLQRQQDAVRNRSRRAYLHTWNTGSPATIRHGARVFANLRKLHASITDFRYVAADSPEPPAITMHRQLDARAWTAVVELDWRLAACSGPPARVLLSVTFVRRGDGAYVASIAPAAGQRRPVWLRGRLDVRRTQRTLAAASTPHEAERLHALLTRAVADVQRVVPSWRGGLVAFEPATTTAFDALLAAAPGAYDGIAAVTTTVDGSTSRRSPVAIFVNPAEFDRLAPVGAQVVISHESTHAATGVAAVGLPLWVAEGFADFVGVGSVDVPLSESAAALIRDIHQHGLPSSLPSNATFRAAGDRLEVAYEQAWLAARLIASEYGEARLLKFYEHVVSSSGRVQLALRAELGTSLRKLTAQWRAYLRTVVRAA